MTKKSEFWDTVRRRCQIVLATRDLNHAQWARAAGIKRTTLVNFLNGGDKGRGSSVPTITKLAQAPSTSSRRFHVRGNY